MEAAARCLAPMLGIELVDVKFGCCPSPVGLKAVHFDAWLALAARNLCLTEEKGLDVVTICSGLHQHPQGDRSHPRPGREEAALRPRPAAAARAGVPRRHEDLSPPGAARAARRSWTRMEKPRSRGRSRGSGWGPTTGATTTAPGDDDRRADRGRGSGARGRRRPPPCPTAWRSSSRPSALR